MDVETTVIEQVLTMGLQELRSQLIQLMVKREVHRRQMNDRTRDATKKAAFSLASRKYYFKKNDIYHPELNPNGLQEKKFKQQVLTVKAKKSKA